MHFFTANSDPKTQPLIWGTPHRVMIALGCSWTRAWGWRDDFRTDSDGSWVDDVDFVTHRSFVGRFAQHIDCTGIINLALPGASNQMQMRLLIELLEQHRSHLGDVFVLWGMTSHHRWEMWSNVVDQPTKFTVGSDLPGHKAAERDWWLKWHYNEGFELQALARNVVLLHHYLNGLGIQHLFFPAFVPFNQHNLQITNMAHKNFYGWTSSNNDMMTLLCDHAGVDRPHHFLSNPYSHDDCDRVSKLRAVGMFSALAHPTALAHQIMGQALIDHHELL